MKILLVNNHHSLVGGAETVYFKTINLLLEYGHQVVTLSRKNEQSIKTNAKEYFIDYSSSFFNRIYSYKARKLIQKIIKVEKPQIAHLHNTVGGITFSILPILKKAGIPIVLTIHDFRILCPAGLFLNRKNEICEKCGKGNYLHCISNNCSRKGLVNSIGISLETYLRNNFLSLKKYIDHLVFVSNFTKNKFLEHANYSKVPSSVVYNPINIEEAKLNRGKYFLYVGRLAPEKGIITLIKAFAQIPDSELHVVGDGPLMSICKKIASNNVKLFGHLSGKELKQQYANSFFTIVPSECYENLPMSAIESLSFSKPVIGSKLGGLKEIIYEGKNGFLFDFGSIVQLKNIIMNCIKISDEIYFSMCKYSSLTASKNNSSAYYADLISIYKRII